MRCIKKRTIRAYIDDELPSKKRSVVMGHLAKCRICREVLKETYEKIGFINKHLEMLKPQRIPPPASLNLEKQTLAVPPKFSLIKVLIFPVRVPAAVLALLVIVSLGFSLIFLKNEFKTTKNLTIGQKEVQNKALIIRSNYGARSIAVDFEMNEFQIIQNPRIFTFKGTD